MKGPWKLAPSAEDLALGQGVIVGARWVLVGSALVLALIPPIRSLPELKVQLLVIIVLAVFNFALHAQLLRRRPTVDAVAFGASMADLVVITILVVNQGGYVSELYVFYLPALFALSLSFGAFLTTVYTGATIAVYAMVAAVTVPEDHVQNLVIRCVMMGAVALCGALYFRLEEGRRNASAEAQQQLAQQIRERAEARSGLAPST